VIDGQKTWVITGLTNFSLRSFALIKCVTPNFFPAASGTG
jgi:hypothetical protein